jgi:hypothetical protein
MFTELYMLSPDIATNVAIVIAGDGGNITTSKNYSNTHKVILNHTCVVVTAAATNLPLLTVH